MPIQKLRKHKDLLFILAVPACQIFFWRRFLFGNLGFVGVGDRLSHEIPFYLFIQRWIQKGVIPFWDPYIGGGVNLLGSLIYTPFYPFQYVMYLFPEHHLLLAQNIYILIHWMMAFFFFTLFAKSYFRSFFAVVISTLIYTFNLYSLIYLGLGNTYFSFVWCPLILWILHRTGKHSFLKYAALFGIVYGLQSLGTFIQSLFTITFLYGIFYLFSLTRENCKYKTVTFLLGLLLGVCLSSARLIPVFSESQTLERGRDHYKEIVSFRKANLYLHKESLFHLIDPYPYGDRSFHSYPFWSRQNNQKQFYWRNFYDFLPAFSSYGAIAISLASWILFVFSRKKGVLSWLLLVPILFWILFADFPKQLLDLFWQKNFVRHDRIAILLPICFAVLSGFGLQTLRCEPTRAKRFLLMLLFVNVALLFPSLYAHIFLSRHYALLQCAILFVVLLLGFVFHRKYQFHLQTLLPLSLVLIVAVELLSLTNRFINPDRTAEEINRMNDFPVTLPYKSLAQRELLKNSLSKTYPLRIALDKDSSYIGLRTYDANFLPHFHEFLTIDGYLNTFEKDFLRFIYYDSDRGRSPIKIPPSYIGIEKISEVAKKVLRQRYILKGDQLVDEGRWVFPQLFLADEIIVTSSSKIDTEYLNFLFQTIKKIPKKKGRLPAILVNQNQRTSKNQYLITPKKTKGTPRFAKLTEFSPNQMLIETQSAAEELLVVNEKFHPNWKAYLDGSPVDILPANAIMRGILVPSGRHQVLLRYEISHLKWIGVLTATGLLGVFLLFIWGEVKNRCRTPKESDTKL